MTAPARTSTGGSVGGISLVIKRFFILDGLPGFSNEAVEFLAQSALRSAVFEFEGEQSNQSFQGSQGQRCM
jgi:hypothetical protein